MNITVTRIDCNDTRCIGKLAMPEFTCYTLEDAVREEKIPGRTAIAAGTYEIVISYSARFKKVLPLLLNVPNFKGVRIHSGNTAEDTEGCLLLGLSRTADSICESRKAMAVVMPALMKWMRKEKVFLVVI